MLTLLPPTRGSCRRDHLGRSQNALFQSLQLNWNLKISELLSYSTLFCFGIKFCFFVSWGKRIRWTMSQFSPGGWAPQPEMHGVSQRFSKKSCPTVSLFRHLKINTFQFSKPIFRFYRMFWCLFIVIAFSRNLNTDSLF